MERSYLGARTAVDGPCEWNDCGKQSTRQLSFLDHAYQETVMLFCKKHEPEMKRLLPDLMESLQFRGQRSTSTPYEIAAFKAYCEWLDQQDN